VLTARGESRPDKPSERFHHLILAVELALHLPVGAKHECPPLPIPHPPETGTICSEPAETAPPGYPASNNIALTTAGIALPALAKPENAHAAAP
jgi:hypothetical protein